jgi:hypothetical protein
MSRRRKLSIEEESALIAWYAQYQAALDQVRKLGSIPKQAQKLGIGVKHVHVVVKRGDYELRRKIRSLRVMTTTRGESLFAPELSKNVKTLPPPHVGNNESAQTTTPEVRRDVRAR